jgi:hypothetical protein
VFVDSVKDQRLSNCKHLPGGINDSGRNSELRLQVHDDDGIWGLVAECLWGNPDGCVSVNRAPARDFSGVEFSFSAAAANVLWRDSQRLTMDTSSHRYGLGLLHIIFS